MALQHEGCPQTPNERSLMMDNVFPYFSSAEAVPLDKVTVGGKEIAFWSYKQLETLSGVALMKRVKDLQGKLEAIGFKLSVDSQPRSRQCDDIIRWILVTQAHLTNPPNLQATAAVLRRFGCPNHLILAETKLPTKRMGYNNLSIRIAPDSGGTYTVVGHTDGHTISIEEYLNRGRRWVSDGHNSVGLQSIRNISPPVSPRNNSSPPASPREINTLYGVHHDSIVDGPDENDIRSVNVYSHFESNGVPGHERHGRSPNMVHHNNDHFDRSRGVYGEANEDARQFAAQNDQYMQDGLERCIGHGRRTDKEVVDRIRREARKRTADRIEEREGKNINYVSKNWEEIEAREENQNYKTTDYYTGNDLNNNLQKDQRLSELPSRRRQGMAGVFSNDNYNRGKKHYMDKSHFQGLALDVTAPQNLNYGDIVIANPRHMPKPDEIQAKGDKFNTLSYRSYHNIGINKNPSTNGSPQNPAGSPNKVYDLSRRYIPQKKNMILEEWNPVREKEFHNHTMQLEQFINNNEVMNRNEVMNDREIEDRWKHEINLASGLPHDKHNVHDTYGKRSGDHVVCVGVFDTSGVKNDNHVGCGHGRKYIDKEFGTGHHYGARGGNVHHYGNVHQGQERRQMRGGNFQITDKIGQRNSNNVTNIGTAGTHAASTGRFKGHVVL